MKTLTPEEEAQILAEGKALVKITFENTAVKGNDIICIVSRQQNNEGLIEEFGVMYDNELVVLTILKGFIITNFTTLQIGKLAYIRKHSKEGIPYPYPIKSIEYLTNKQPTQ